MSQFDPFASTPAASSNNNAGGGGQSKSSTTNAAADNNNNGTKNPFDIFGSSSTYTNGNNNNQNSQNGGGGMASLMNPFQQFSTTTQQQQQQQPANANTATSATTSFWQQSNAVIATAMNPSSPSSMWKTLGGVGGATTASSSSLAASSTTSSSTAAAAAGMKYKRVVPYTGPIANLESNWDPWLYNAANAANNKSNNSVNMTYLIVKANQSCIVPGGVESVLKWMKLHKHANNNHPNGGGKVVMDDLTMNLESKLSLEECGSGGDQQQQLGDFDATITTNNVNNNETNNNNNNNGGGGNKKFGKLFKSGLKKAQASITHSVTSIAIKADGGKNPDWVCASLHYNLGGEKNNVVNNNNNNRGMWNAIGGNCSSGGGGVMGDVCLCKTEWIPLPPLTNFGSGDLEEERGKQISFAVPLCVPDLSFLESSSAGGGGGGGDNGIVLTVRLYLRSGATLLKAAAIKKEYCIGESSLLYSQLLSSSSGAGGNGQYYRTMNLQFTNGMLADPSSYTYNYNPDSPPMLNLMALPRVKFTPSCKIGWSLTDPTPMPPSSVAALRWLNMFQLPLDQSYAYPMGATGAAAGAIIVANECARESTVTLPLATACAKLFSDAAMQSQQRASMIAAQSRRRESVRSYAIPPEMDINRANAMVDMALRDGCMEVNLGVVAFVVSGDKSLGGIQNLTSGAERVPSVRMSVTFQRHDSIFEEGIISGSIPLLDQSPTFPNEAVRARFCPRIMTGVPEIDGFELLHGVAGTKPNGKYVGNVRFEVENTSFLNVNDNLIVPSGQSAPIEGLLELEPYLDQATANEGEKTPVLVPAIDANNGKRIGTFVLVVQVRALLDGAASSSRTSDALPPASLGLVSAVGLDTLMEDLALAPSLDYDSPSSTSQQPPSATAVEMRRRQVATMGTFLTPRYLQNQADVVRSNVTSALCDRYDKYYNSVLSGISPDVTIEDDSHVELYERRKPRPFRPSNSRGDELLAGIGFNVHCQGLSIDILQNGAVTPAAVHYSVTHGAPADHAAGFGVQGMDESTDSGVEASSGARGGLRRLEMKRVEYAKELEDSISGLIRSVGEHFKMRAQVASARQQAGIKMSRHIPPGVAAITHYRNKAIECAQRLNSLTWNIAARRANCFSQALGIAVTSYLASLSDGSHASKGYASIWQRHGYLVTFEGLLSAVGKELGMIEDASIAVQMLRKVHIVLVSDDGTVSSSNGERQRVPVPHSPCVNWVHLACLTPNGSHSKTQYRLEIGLNASYYQNRVPEPLKNGAAVRLFPVLFQMGVDIRQWGVNAGRQIKDKSKVGGLTTSESFGDAQNISGMNEGVGGLIDDGDDDGDEVGMADNEIGFQLNVDGFRKLNAYAHSVNPTVAGGTAASSPLPVFDSSEQVQMQSLPPHPLLVPLSESIKASAGKMEHSVLDHAAASCQKLGGGSTVFCKSGKDRTGMQVTFKEAQFIQRFIERKDAVSSEEIFAKATTMRIYGNRVPICEKNAGEAMYAFNPLQAQFMPAMLKPPPITTQWKKPET